MSLNEASLAVNPDVADAASIIGASAWDFDSMPGTAADVLRAWQNAAFAKIRRVDGGSEEEDARYRTLRRQAREMALNRVGPTPDSADAGQLDEELIKLTTGLDAALAHKMSSRSQRLIEAAAQIPCRHAYASAA